MTPSSIFLAFLILHSGIQGVQVHVASPSKFNSQGLPQVTIPSLGTAVGKIFPVTTSSSALSSSFSPGSSKQSTVSFTVAGFLGLPYAQKPINDLRFRPPMELESWGVGEGEVFNATHFGPICVQPGEQKIWDVVYTKSGRGVVRKKKLSAYSMSEDCLTLNVFVPWNSEKSRLGDEDNKELLPVMFFIHGGSYYMNGGWLYPGQVIAATQRIIVITFNYRLGPFGFLSTADAAAPGNFGLLDQNMALTWVTQHIQHFGGDPERVTLVGNSAGAAGAMFHMFSDLSKGKFVGMTVQSGCSGAPWAVQMNPRKHASDLASKLGCPTLPTHDLVACLRTFSAELIMKNAKLEDGLSLAYAAVIDGKYGGKFLRDHPKTLIKTKSFHPVPILTGFTKDEVTIWFTKFGPTSKTKDLRSFVQVDVVSLLQNLPSVTEANVAAMIHAVTVQYLYRSGIGENDTMGKTSAVSDFISDVGLKSPCKYELDLLSTHTSAPIYLYEFQYTSVDDIKMGRQEWIGAYHESELQYIFGEPYLNFSNHLRSYDDRKMGDVLMKVWSNFIKTGNPTPPNSKDLKFKWTNYTAVNQDFAVLSLKSHMDKMYLTERMLFWNFFFPIFRDYPFRYEDGKDCASWEHLRSLWIFWLLLVISLVLIVILALLLLAKVRRRETKGMTSSNTPNNLPLVPR